MEIIWSLIEGIEVYPGEKRGQRDVILAGSLAQILSYAQHKNTAVSGGDDGTFYLVAGVGFGQERTNLRLARAV